MANPTLNEEESDNTAAAPAAEPGDQAPAADDAAEQLRRDNQSLQDRLLRSAAEFDNYRKRVDRERRELSEFAAADVLKDLLPIIDNFDRAMQAPATAETDALRKGIELIHKQMLDLLRKRGVRPIEAVGTPFDPRVHEAVMQEESDEHEEGQVMQELQRGYMLGERLLRPATVKVAKRS